ncbi:tetratricopeptide repeat protein [Kitasatospora sp. NPDC096204]|uniref:tetratricopeptide repeat protein n=1 Tax=Kitasatospora sp. NPDC096204 TaxID=3364094 RepID=UPI003803D711
MAQARKRLSRAEALRRRAGARFVGRRAQLALFTENLRKSPDPEATDDPADFLFHVRGVGGVGKSTLIAEWREAARRSGALTAVVDESDVHGVESALAALARQLSEQAGPLKEFDKALDEYRRARQAAADRVPEPPAGGGTASLPSRMVTQAAFGAASMLPGGGVVAAIANPDNVALGADRLLAGMRQRRRGNDGEEAALNRAFVTELEKLCGRDGRWVVLFLDTWEQTGRYLDAWLRELLDGAYGEVPLDVMVVLAGREELSERDWGVLRPAVVDVPLDVFTEQETRELLAVRGVTDPEMVEAVTLLSMRLPLLVALLAQSDLQAVDDVAEADADLTDHAVERFLLWIPEPERRETVLAAALPLQLNHDLFACAVPGVAADAWDWLLSQPFVSGRGSYRQYHAVVRASLLRRGRTHSPRTWATAQERLAAHYAAEREVLEQRLPEHRRPVDARWRRLALNETYHSLCADPVANLPRALEYVAWLVAADLAGWVDMLGQAAKDTEDTELAGWHRRLCAMARAEEPEAEVLTALCAPGMPSRVRAWALAVRGDYHCVASRFDEARADLDRAVLLAPEFPMALVCRGRVNVLTSRTEEALVDLDAVLDLDPVLGAALAYRGVANLSAGRLDAAVDDFSAALESDPSLTWVFRFRGQTHRLAGRLGEAMADFASAHEASPTDAWALARRGEAHCLAGRLGEALADFDAALELDSEDAAALGFRGEIHRADGRLGEALADFDAALELDPEMVWVRGLRGEIHKSEGRLDEALADFDAALAQDESLAWVFGLRAGVHQAAGRLDDALSDLTVAVALDPREGWTLARRGDVHRSAGRSEQAVADFTAALELGAEAEWVLARRGETHMQAGRTGEALADFAAALEIDPASALALVNRGIILQEAGRLEDAVAEYTALLERCPEYGRGSLVVRGEARRQAGQLDEAVADLTAALDLDPGDAWALGCLGRANGLLGRFDAAVANLSAGLGDTPELLWIACALAAVHRRSGRVEEARSVLRRATEIGPADLGVLEETAVQQLLDDGRAGSLTAWDAYLDAARDSESRIETATAELLHGLVAGRAAPGSLAGGFLATPGIRTVLLDVCAYVEELAHAELPVGPRADAALRVLRAPAVA